MWQSMNIPGIPFETHAMTGAPSRGRKYQKCKMRDNVPIVILGTKWLKSRNGKNRSYVCRGRVTRP